MWVIRVKKMNEKFMIHNSGVNTSPAAPAEPGAKALRAPRGSNPCAPPKIIFKINLQI